MNPGRAKLADLQGAIERLEDLMRRYCSRRDSSGKLAAIPEDIKMAALESLCPEDLEKHIQMSSARLEAYDKMRVEIVMYIEASRKSGKLTKPSQGYYPQRGGDPMDVDAFSRKGGCRADRCCHAVPEIVTRWGVSVRVADDMRARAPES